VILDGDEQSARVQSADTIFYDEEFPVLNVREVNGELVLVGGPEYENIISSQSGIAEVVVTMVPPSGWELTVTATSGPVWYQLSTGSWRVVIDVPSPGNETISSFDVEMENTQNSTRLSGNGHFKIKKQADG
jgi:hypothetical protein